SAAAPSEVAHTSMRRSGSATIGEAAMSADTVLNVADMRRLAPRLGTQVEIQAIPGGMHDLVLSPPAAREQVWQILGQWLARCRSMRHPQP
ncbi:MAG TPA: hypothetical protein PLW86_12640, partial [Rhodocyclaceae bacterium]|nr:hypothetical protein [Rhodocyclaceae bacterium]